MNESQGYFFFERLATPDAPGGITVSKRSELPSGDFPKEAP